jgi:benzoate membrane transport protein
MTGVASLLLAPFGGYALNFSAITAAICMGPEAHEDKDKRYTAAVACGACTWSSASLVPWSPVC